MYQNFLNRQIQKVLVFDNHYDGEIDGILGRKSMTAIKKLLKSYGIDITGWSAKRLRVAAEQALYRSLDISVGPIDGYEGPQTNHAREVYKAMTINTWRDEIEKIEPPPVKIDRSRFASEMTDPNVRDTFEILINAEVGSQGREAQTAFVETVFNRAVFQNETINQIITNERYYQPYQDGAFERAKKRITKTLRKDYSRIIDHVLNNGSNITNVASHNASGEVAKNAVTKYDAVPESLVVFGGETFYYKTFEVDKRNKLIEDSQNKKEPQATPPTVTFKPKTNWPRQKDLDSFFGEKGQNQVSCNLPYEMVIAWNTKQKVRSFSCHRLVKEPLERIFTRTLEHYGYEKIKEMRLHYFGGCLNVRRVRGGSSWSTHSWGIAIDLDPDRNQLRWDRKRASFAKPEYKKFWEFVYDEGFISLGIERDYDWMHFQAARL